MYVFFVYKYMTHPTWLPKHTRTILNIIFIAGNMYWSQKKNNF